MGLINNAIRTQWEGIAYGSAQALLPGNVNCYAEHEKFINQEGATTVLKTVASPTGYQLPRCFQPPINLGEMSMGAPGMGAMTADLYPTLAMEIDLTGTGDLEATAALVIAMALAMTGDGSLTATIEGRLNASIAMTGTGDLDATIGALGNMIAGLTGTGDLEATIAAYGNMEIDIVVTGTGLTTANVGDAVWAYLLASGYSAKDAMSILTAVAAGKTDITGATVTFRGLDDTNDVVVADMTGSERTTVTLDP